MSILSSPSTGLEAAASDLSLQLIHTGQVSSPIRVSPAMPCATICAAIVEKHLDPALQLPSEFKLNADRQKFDLLVRELREHARNVDTALARLQGTNVLPICKGELLSELESVRDCVHSREVSEFAMVERRKGDDLGVRWQRTDFYPKPGKTYDPNAVLAGDAIADAYDAVKAEVQRRLCEYKNSQASRVDTFEAGPLVGRVALNPSVLLERVPASLHSSIKALMQGATTPTPAACAEKIERSPERHSPAVYLALRYATLHGCNEPLLAMARAFPEHQAETLDFAHVILDTPEAAPRIKHAAALAVAHCDSRYSMPELAKSPVMACLSPHERDTVIRHWLSDPDRCDGLDAEQRKFLCAAISESIAPADVALLQAIAQRHTDLWHLAAVQSTLLRASEPSKLQLALQAAGARIAQWWEAFQSRHGL